MRITRPIAKVLYVATWFLGTGVVTTAMNGPGGSDYWAVMVGMGLTTLFIAVGVRTFRGRGEAVAPPRRWWRATATAWASLVIGLWAAAATFASLVVLPFQPPDAERLSLIITATLLIGFIAAFYLHSSYRLRGSRPDALHADLQRGAARGER